MRYIHVNDRDDISGVYERDGEDEEENYEEPQPQANDPLAYMYPLQKMFADVRKEVFTLLPNSPDTRDRILDDLLMIYARITFCHFSSKNRRR